MKILYPMLNDEYINAIASVTSYTRTNVYSDNPSLSTIISTRSVHAQCELALDGFTYTEVMEANVIPMFSDDGGINSERAEMRQKIQAHAHLDSTNPTSTDESGSGNDYLFDV